MTKKTLTDVNVTGKKVLLRVDYNVPLNTDGSIGDDTRIKASLPTIVYLLKHGCRIILCSHLDNPKGKIVESLRLVPIGIRLEELLGRSVCVLKDCVGQVVVQTTNQMAAGDIILLENLRFNPGEESNDTEFARSLAGLADIYINDAFAVSHRAHASVIGVLRYLPSATGFLMEKELRVLSGALLNPERPFTAIIGGAKVSDKLGVLDHILDKVDVILIGGGMVATFLKSRGYKVGASFVENGCLDYVARLSERAQLLNVKLLVPRDVLVAERADERANVILLPVNRIPEGWFIVDIGLSTAGLFIEEIKKSRTVIWNGPMGIFEMPKFARGTRLIAQNLAELDTTTIIGGGSTAEAVTAMGLADRMTHVSTGGGTTLEFLEGKELPGIAALPDMDNKQSSQVNTKYPNQ